MTEKKKGFVEDLVEDVTTNPDGPQNSDRTPPQTTDAEPTSDWPAEHAPGRTTR